MNTQCNMWYSLTFHKWGCSQQAFERSRYLFLETYFPNKYQIINSFCNIPESIFTASSTDKKKQFDFNIWWKLFPTSINQDQQSVNHPITPPPTKTYLWSPKAIKWRPLDALSQPEDGHNVAQTTAYFPHWLHLYCLQPPIKLCAIWFGRDMYGTSHLVQCGSQHSLPVCQHGISGWDYHLRHRWYSASF